MLNSLRNVYCVLFYQIQCNRQSYHEAKPILLLVMMQHPDSSSSTGQIAKVLFTLSILSFKVNLLIEHNGLSCDLTFHA